MAETPDQLTARAVLDPALGVSLAAAEAGTLATTDGTVAVAVASVGHQADAIQLLVPSLARPWWVVTEGGVPERLVRDRLPGAVQDLERHSIDRYEAAMDWWLGQMPTLSTSVGRLQDLGVLYATQTRLDHVPKDVTVSAVEGLPATAPDDTLAGLEAALPAGTGRWGPALERHLAVVADWPAPAGFRPRRRRGDPAPPEHPSRPPARLGGADRLWLVHRLSGWAWSWDGSTWATVPAREGLSGHESWR